MINKIITLFRGNVRLLLIKICRFKRLSYNIFNNISAKARIELSKTGNLTIGKKFIMRDNSILGVRNKATIKIGNKVFINRNCYIVSHDCIMIGDNVSIGPNTVIVDHDHKFDSITGINEKEYKTKKIIINEGVWIGANCTILKGTSIGKNSVIAAGSVVSFDVPDNTVLIQKRENSFIKQKKDKD